MVTSKVGVVEAGKFYSRCAPFNPHKRYPEYLFKDNISKETNNAYEGVRNLLLTLGMDTKNFGKSNWNPLGEIIKPGMTVVVKPNFVLSKHSEHKNIYSIITHPSVIRAVSDYALIALNGRGSLTIADAPQYNCDFKELISVTKLDKLIEFYAKYSKISVKLYDLREYWSKGLHMPSGRINLTGDPKGSVIVNLGERSSFYGKNNQDKYYGAVYHRQETIKHHIGKKQEYEISKTILDADVIVSLPKMKVHKKVGVTLNGKGLVGTCTNKNLLVHYSLGTPSNGGDQFPDGVLTKKEQIVIKFERWMYDTFLSKRSVLLELVHRLIYGVIYLRVIRHLGLSISKSKRMLDAGNWYGNDSAWRMVADLMKVIHFANKNGKITKTPQRKFFSIVDGIMGGEGNGPLKPDPKITGLIVGGENLLAVDIVTSRLMGFDHKKIKQFSICNDELMQFGVNKNYNIKVFSKNKKYVGCLKNKDAYLKFKPHPGWTGRIEI